MCGCKNCKSIDRVIGRLEGAVEHMISSLPTIEKRLDDIQTKLSVPLSCQTHFDAIELLKKKYDTINNKIFFVTGGAVVIGWLTGFLSKYLHKLIKVTFF